jgi:predicted metalloprotease with PDZ domain
MTAVPQPITPPSPLPLPQDVPYDGLIRLCVDATDVQRRIFQVQETIPVKAGPLVLLYPKWLPGYHSPQAPIELLAGLRITAGDQVLDWRRDPVEVYAFHLQIPQGITEIVAEFQFVSPTGPAQGRVTVTPVMLNLQWNTVVLYPAGYFSRGIEVVPELTLPKEWKVGCALDRERQEGCTTHFRRVSLDTLVDSPVFAGLHYRQDILDDEGAIRLNIVADRPDLLAATPEHIAIHKQLVVQADRLFGARHFDHFDFLLALSDELGSIGVEHHRSCETGTVENYFTGWDVTFSRRDVIAHEYTHSWNGKFRRGADSWTPSFEQPIRNSLMWVYEGQTQYWGQVLAARSGLWTKEQALGALAHTAATYDHRPGGRWRPLADTTRDPVIASRSPLPWASWQRSEDYYSEGELVWLEVDTLLRELSNDTHSLDDFARSFFGGDDGSFVTNTYEFEDVVRTLDGVASYRWSDFFEERLRSRQEDAPLAGLTRGGYKLVYRDEQNSYSNNNDTLSGMLNLAFSIGLSCSTDGTIQEVIWEGPAFTANLTAGSQLLAVNGRKFTLDELRSAIVAAQNGTAIKLLVQNGKRVEETSVHYSAGLRFPHLEPLSSGHRRLDAIL